MTKHQTITIDGSEGEGGGQILRSSLTLSLITGKPFRIENIRSRRKKPGLLRQHLTAVRAAAKISRAKADGASMGSQRLMFAPRKVRPGEFRFVVGTAGSATLVLQTVLPALITAEGPSKMAFEGGTHNPWAPPFDFLQKTFLPIIHRMGPKVDATLQRPGFYPAGDGSFTVEIEPQSELRRVDLPERGRLGQCHVTAFVARLPITIAEREVRTVLDRLGWPDECGTAEEVDSTGPGNCVTVEIAGQHVTEVCTGFGRKGILAEKVAEDAAEQAERYLAAAVPVGEHLADQLLIPMALAGGGSFRTLAPSTHLKTNIDVVRRFLDVEIRAEQISSEDWQVSVSR